MDILRLRRLGDNALQLGGRDELGLAAVPLREDLGAGGTAQDARVDEAGEADVREVARGAEDAFEVPDGFRAVDRINRGLSTPSRTTAEARDGNLKRGTTSGTYALGYISSKNPPPLSLSKTPVNPHGCSWNGCTSWISTTRTSPGSAPSTSKGPVR